MNTILLSQGMVAVVDDADYELVSAHKWCAKKIDNLYYAKTNIRLENGKQKGLYMHRLILGLTDPKIITDHIDGDGLNNQRKNIRECTRSKNQCNRRKFKNNKSGFKGVSWSKQAQKWIAEIRFEGKKKYLGCYTTPEDGHAAYCKAAAELHGEFANVGQ